MSEWKEYKLGNAPLAIIDGDRGKNYPSQEEFTSIGDCLFLSTRNVRLTGFDFSDCQFISKKRDGLLRKGKLERNDLVLTTRGTVGNIGFYSPSIQYDNVRINSGMVIIRPNVNELLPSFNYYVFRHLQKDFLTFTTGSAQPQLPIRDLNEIEIKLPPLPEQIQIASILSSLDDKIDLLHRQNKTLEQLAETLFRQWFVEEAEWKGRLSEYVKVQGGYAFKSKDFKTTGFAGVIKIRNISMGIIDISNSDFVDEGVVKNLDKRFKIKSGDFLIAMTGAEIGKIGIVEKTEREIWLNQRVGKLEAKVPYGNIIGYLALKAREGQDHITNACAGSAQENISTTGLEEMLFASYDAAKSNSFGEEAEPLFDKIIFNLNQIRTLTRLRDTLLPKLMSGEVRVKEYEKTV